MAYNKKIDIDLEHVKKYFNSYGEISKSINTTPEIDLNNNTIKECYNSKRGGFSVDDVKAKMQAKITNIRNVIANTVYGLREVDKSIDLTPYKNKPGIKINKKSEAYVRGAKQGNGDLIPADKEYFLYLKKKYGAKLTIRGNEVSWTSGGKTYTYNLKSHQLKINNKINDDSKNQRFKIFVPKNYKYMDMRNVPTIMALSKFDSNVKKASQPSIVIVSNSWNPKNAKAKKVSQTLVAGMTRFVNGTCKARSKYRNNVIMGGSVFGTYALKINANDTTLYDTIVCINTSGLLTNDKNVTVKDKNGKLINIKSNGKSGEKLKITDQELNKLAKTTGKGKTYYFISTSEDPNFFNGKDTTWNEKATNRTSKRMTNSYTYTGMEILSNLQPDATIYASTNYGEYEKVIKKGLNGKVKYVNGKNFFKNNPKLHGDYGNVMDNIFKYNVDLNPKKA